MAQTPQPGHAPVVFSDDAFDEDVTHAGSGGRAAAEAARRGYEQDGVPVDQLRHVEDEGRDGTILPNVSRSTFRHPPAASAWSSSSPSKTAAHDCDTWPSAPVTPPVPARSASTRSPADDSNGSTPRTCEGRSPRHPRRRSTRPRNETDHLDQAPTHPLFIIHQNHGKLGSKEWVLQPLPLNW
jgi:hypothetical protein